MALQCFQDKSAQGRDGLGQTYFVLLLNEIEIRFVVVEGQTIGTGRMSRADIAFPSI